MSGNEIHLKENFRNFQLTLPENFKCSLCPAKFRYRINLNAHYANVHQKIKCGECDSYMSQRNLGPHKLCHRKGTTKSTAVPGRYKCDQCESTFTRTSSLNDHKRDIHEGVKMVCDGCSTTFKNHGSFRKHVCTENRENKQQKLQVKRKKLTEILGPLAPWENFEMDLTMPVIYRLTEGETLYARAKISKSLWVPPGKRWRTNLRVSPSDLTPKMWPFRINENVKSN